MWPSSGSVAAIVRKLVSNSFRDETYRWGSRYLPVMNSTARQVKRKKWKLPY
jgi:hypothetical protein